MIALLSALLGFVSSAVPDLLKLFRDGKDRAHEITLLQMQMEYDRERRNIVANEKAAARDERLEAISMQSMVLEQAALNDRLKDNLTGIHWVDALAGSVRPILTYAFFGLYFLVKCAQFHLLLNPALSLQNAMTLAQAMVALWTEEDIAIFSAVIAFWFGQRAMTKTKR
jgi:FtsZ-binding cell division protein ZapB